MHDGRAKTIERDATEIAEEARHVTVMALLMHQMRRGTRDKHDDRRDHAHQDGPRVRVAEVEREYEQESVNGTHVMRPSVYGLVVLGEQRSQVEAVRLVDGSEARVNVRLAEQLGCVVVCQAMFMHCLQLG